MKKYLLFFTFFVLFSFGNIAHGECQYLEEWKDCQQKNNKGQAHSVSEYLCVSSVDDERMLYNIILDKEFGKIDKKMYDFLVWLETSKDYFFGTEAKASFFQGIDIIGIKFGKNGEYWQEYNKVCSLQSENSITKQVFACFKEQGRLSPSVTNANVTNYFAETNCMRMAMTKLKTHEKVAYDVLKLNKAYVRKDNRTSFHQSQRDKYTFLLDSMRINVSYLGKMVNRWTSKTKNAHQ